MFKVLDDIALAIVRPDLADVANRFSSDEALLESEANKRDISVEALLLIYGTDYDSVIVWKDGAPRVKLPWDLRHAIRNSTFIA